MTKNRWRLVDAYCHNGAGSVWFSFWPIEAADTMFMTMCNLSSPRFSKIHDQESLTLRWCSFSRWGREHFTVSSAYKGSQDAVYGYTQSVAHQIMQVTCPRLVDAPLTLIVIMGQGAFHSLFCLWRQPILRVWWCATCWGPGYPR
jgi:hypothetical protein